jgi:hypothetical protein
MVLMLRHLGIPARAVSGYAEGFFDEENGGFWVTDADAHTWVEVFFPNFGWVEFEPTAGESPLDRPEGLDPNAPESLAGAATPNAANPLSATNAMADELLQDELMNQGSAAGAMAEAAGGRWWLWALLTPVLLVLGVLGLRRTQMLGPTAFTPELPPILYERLQRWAERLGIGVRASETPYEQARTFGRALPEGQPLISEITDTYVRYRFSRQNLAEPAPAQPVAGGAGQRLVEAWQQLQPLLWRAWGRKLTAIGGRRNPFDLR